MHPFANRIVYYWDAAFAPYDTNRGLLHPYLKNSGVFQCPSAAGIPVIGGRLTAYGHNQLLFSQPLATLTAPSDTVVLTDSVGSNPSGALARTTVIWQPAYHFLGFWTATVHGRHTGRANVLWADGHVNSARPEFPTYEDRADMMQRLNLGWVMHPAYRFDQRPQRDFYYLPAKP